jgi:hypothetical protein
MAEIESKVTIARPREEVFGYFLALEENVPRTNPDVEWVVKTPDGPTRVGTTLRSRGKVIGQDKGDDDAVHRDRAERDDPVRGRGRADAAEVRVQL